MTTLLKVLGSTHGALVHSRRVRVLAREIAGLIPPGSRVLDVGCGDGTLARLVASGCQGVEIGGFEIAPRDQTVIPVTPFDGVRLPVEDASADIVMFVDVLHHTDDPMILLREAVRVARLAIIIKDHRMSRPDASLMLRFMDWVGNRPHGVRLPYNYWPERRWRETWAELGLDVESYRTQIGIYPWPADLVFGAGLHFVAKLTHRSGAGS